MKCGWRALMIALGIGLIGMATPPSSHYGGVASGPAASLGGSLEADMVSVVTPAAAPARAPAAAPAAAHASLPATAGSVALRTAISELGKPYRYGAAGPRSFDCSGLTLFAYQAAGINLPHYAAAQWRSGRHIARNDLQPGDLIFWAGLGHVGIYLGGGQMIHAPSAGHVVSVISIDSGRFVGAVRPG